MTISAEDSAKLRRGTIYWKAEITDIQTDRKYLVRGIACGAPNCKCDSYIDREIKS